ncbi:MAG: CerR family C-terminal domain-containing protein [Planctomycetota bacterium]
MPGSETALKRRLIETALVLFTRQGYRSTSLRQIAEHAGVSHGSVRYHFGSKRVLYKTAMGSMRPENMGMHFPRVPPAEEMTQDQAVRLFEENVTALARVMARVGEQPEVARAYIENEGGPGEAPNPEFYRRVIAPGHEAMKRTIRAMRPDLQDERTLEILVFNVIGQCLALRMGRGVVLKRLKKRTLTQRDIDEFAKRIVEVSLAGVRALRVEG